jgi:hypothetical protein
VLPFFTDVQNLESITPGWMSFFMVTLCHLTVNALIHSINSVPSDGT